MMSDFMTTLIILLYIMLTFIWTRACLDELHNHNQRAVYSILFIGLIVLTYAAYRSLSWAMFLP